jgi:MATE family multidrug resistance protein
MFTTLVFVLLWVESKRSLPRWGSNVRIDFGRIIALLRLGAPAATQIMLEISAFAAATALCAKLGPLPLSGHEIALSCAAFTFMVPLGISSAAAVRVGQYLGKRDPQGARRAGWSAIALGCGFMSCSGLIFVLLPTQIARLFSPDPVVIKVALRFAGGRGVSIVRAVRRIVVALRGTGDTRTPMLANLVAYWFIGLPVGYLLCFRMGWGAVGVWIGLCVGLILIGSVLLIAWNRRLHSDNPITVASNVSP